MASSAPLPLGAPIPPLSDARARGGRSARTAAYASVAVAAALGLLKFAGVLATGSVSLLASLADSGLDLIAALITLGAVTWALQPADEDHRFGHGKAEALAALAQGALMLGSMGIIAWDAAVRLADPVSPTRPEIGIAVSVVAALATFALLAVQRRAIRRSRSVAINADRLHYKTDLGVNLAVILALGLEFLGLMRGADALFGLGIAAYLGVSGARASRAAVDLLMDKEWPEPERQRLLALAAQHPLVCGVHDLRTRGTGLHHFAQFHIWVDPQMSVGAAHEVVDAVEARIRDAFPGVGVLVHVDPTGHRDQRPPHG